jgi:hypothetical protein
MGLTFVPGQQVVWSYQPPYPPRRPILVDAEITQVGQLRTRIRIRTMRGETLFRWVHPKNLRPKAPDESEYPYPEAR